VREHLICDGFLKGYRTWTLHGEASSSFEDHGTCDVPDFIEQPSEDDDISELIRDLACGLNARGDMEDDGSFEPSNEDIAAIHKLNVDNRQELYPGCFTSNLLEDGPIEVLICWWICLSMHCLRVQHFLETFTKLKNW
jgi:hypothetical protein